MLKQQFRQQKRVAFSNNFEPFKSIDVGGEVYDVRISKSCSLIIVIKEQSLIFYDYETWEIKGQSRTDSAYFEIEEDYDNCGNDALLTFQNGTVLKHDLKQLITDKENCKPIWTYSAGSDHGTSKPVSVMILNGKKVVVFNDSKSMCFLDARTGKKQEEYTLDMEDYVYGCFGPDHLNPNTLYLFSIDLKKFEYENGKWNCSSININVSDIDGFCTDRVSGVIYISGYLERNNKWCIHTFTSLGNVVGTYPVACAGLCIDDRTGLMYTAVSDKISILK